MKYVIYLNNQRCTIYAIYFKFDRDHALYGIGSGSGYVELNSRAYNDKLLSIFMMSKLQ